MTRLLDGKVAVVTGAAGAGIGFATARRCLEEGAKVVLGDIHGARVEAVGSALRDDGFADVGAVRCDSRVEADVRALIAAAVERFGHLDVMVNNAGMGGQVPIFEMTDEDWAASLDVNLTSVMRGVRAAVDVMLPRRSGSIVNVASVVGWRAEPGQAHYGAAKAGVMALTRCAAADVAEHGIRINAVAPSLALNPFLSKVFPQEHIDRLAGRELLGRGAEPVEVANTIVFLASDLASFVTGEVLSVSSQHP